MTENEPLMFAWICIITVLNPLFAPENPWVVSCAVYGDFSKGLKTLVTFMQKMIKAWMSPLAS